MQTRSTGPFFSSAPDGTHTPDPGVLLPEDLHCGIAGWVRGDRTIAVE